MNSEVQTSAILESDTPPTSDNVDYQAKYLRISFQSHPLLTFS